MNLNESGLASNNVTSKTGKGCAPNLNLSDHNLLNLFSAHSAMEASPNSSNPTKKTKIEDSNQNHEDKDAHFPYSAPVAIDIGGSFTKIVYWRPPAPPDLPSYIIKEFQDHESKLPIKPDPTLRLYIGKKISNYYMQFLVILFFVLRNQSSIYLHFFR